MAHSPGPWCVKYGDAEYDTADAVYGIFSADGSRIVETDTGVYPPNADDARLIAAAPEMYDFIKSMENWVPGDFIDDETACQIHALLAKIEGR